MERLRDNERLVLENLSPQHPRLATSLPGVRPRAFTDRVRPKTPNNWPNMIHAGSYSATLHYLKTVHDMGAAEPVALGDLPSGEALAVQLEQFLREQDDSP